MAVKYLATGRIQGTNAERLALSGASSQTSWKELGRYTLTSSSDSIKVGNGTQTGSGTGTGSYASKDNLMVLVSLIPTGGTITGRMHFNDDEASNYSRRKISDGGSSGAEELSGIDANGQTRSNQVFSVFRIKNISDQQKLVMADLLDANTEGTGNTPNWRQVVGKWDDLTETIQNITVKNNGGAGDYASGSEVVVLGCDDDEADSGTNFWQQINTVTPTSAGASNIESGAITSKKYVWFEVYVAGKSASTFCEAFFNNSTSQNYCAKPSENYGTSYDRTNGSDLNIFESYSGTTPDYLSCIFVNISGEEKVGIAHTVRYVSGNAPRCDDVVWKFTDKTAPITDIEIKPQSGTLSADSTIRVWGSD